MIADAPVVPPPAGAWIRARLLPATFYRSVRLEAAWQGLWHLATGDISLRWPFGASSVVRCGKYVDIRVITAAGQLLGDCVVADERPTVDLCSSCLRYSGDVAAADYVARARRRRPVVLPTETVAA